LKPLSSLGSEEARSLRGLLFDLDDTVLTHGRLTEAAFRALWRLRGAGLELAAVTGRPSGWGDVLARQWPIAGCITENGAVSVVRRGAALVREEGCGPEERRDRRRRLEAIVERVRAVVPEAQLTDDVGARRSDVTWDIGETARLPEDRTRAIVREIVAAGARWSRSSVHLHATFDVDDKASGAVRFCVRQFGEDAGGVLSRFAFVGDSGNDAACFSAFRTTFGVANVGASLGRLVVTPRYVASAEMGEGFAEIADAVVAKRLAP
jgi:hypothetical protein